MSLKSNKIMREGGFEPPKALSHEISYNLVSLLFPMKKRHLKSRAFDHFATPAITLN